eukprot:4861614-Prymnesium_polylepis.1
MPIAAAHFSRVHLSGLSPWTTHRFPLYNSLSSRVGRKDRSDATCDETPYTCPCGGGRPPPARPDR